MSDTGPIITRRQLLIWATAVVGVRVGSAFADGVTGVDSQAYFAGVNRALEALARLGEPLAASDASQIAVLARQGDAAAVAGAERILDRYTLVRITTEADGYPRTIPGGHLER